MGGVEFVSQHTVWARRLLDFSIDPDVVGGHRKGTITFDGHWYSLDRGEVTLPYTFLFCQVTTKEGYVYQFDDMRVTNKEDVKDTSEYWHDDEVGAMCLFPTKIIRIAFTVGSHNNSSASQTSANRY